MWQKSKKQYLKSKDKIRIRAGKDMKIRGKSKIYLCHKNNDNKSAAISDTLETGNRFGKRRPF